MLRKLMATAIVALALPASALAAMQASEIKSEVIGKNLSFQGANGSKGKVRHSANGKSRVWGTNFKPAMDSGTWRMKGNRLCVTWKKLRDGKEDCFTMTKTGAKAFRTSRGVTITAR